MKKRLTRGPERSGTHECGLSFLQNDALLMVLLQQERHITKEKGGADWLVGQKFLFSYLVIL